MMRERVLEDRSNPLEDLLPKQVKAKYRFEPDTIYALCRLLQTKLQCPTRRSNSDLIQFCGKFWLVYVFMLLEVIT